jgi:hypothetical protein
MTTICEARTTASETPEFPERAGPTDEQLHRAEPCRLASHQLKGMPLRSTRPHGRPRSSIWSLQQCQALSGRGGSGRGEDRLRHGKRIIGILTGMGIGMEVTGKVKGVAALVDTPDDGAFNSRDILKLRTAIDCNLIRVDQNTVAVPPRRDPVIKPFFDLMRPAGYGRDAFKARMPNNRKSGFQIAVQQLLTGIDRSLGRGRRATAPATLATMVVKRAANSDHELTAGIAVTT